MWEAFCQSLKVKKQGCGQKAVLVEGSVAVGARELRRPQCPALGGPMSKTKAVRRAASTGPGHEGSGSSGAALGASSTPASS